ncbi:hypothetical protein AMEX_G8335 [Astyanax mexicanus]|uniref:Uncharacterized protein n=1 Tax=Astyanax mexicanus TaxID=7994 RepID=A0A8T2LYS0_ASTMX|nr:hypothetical protein AMEX_G8335 [Astyanax mexicanus]
MQRKITIRCSLSAVKGRLRKNTWDLCSPETFSYKPLSTNYNPSDFNPPRRTRSIENVLHYPFGFNPIRRTRSVGSSYHPFGFSPPRRTESTENYSDCGGRNSAQSSVSSMESLNRYL